MAHVTFKKDQPIQALSGTVGDRTFRTRNGKTYMTRLQTPVLPKNPTRKQRALYRRLRMIDQCVMIVQAQIPDIPEAIAMRSRIKDRLMYLYDKLSPTIKAPTKLQKAIMEAYYEKVSKMTRESLENDSVKSRKKNATGVSRSSRTQREVK